MTPDVSIASIPQTALNPSARWRMLVILTIFAAVSSIDKNFLSLLVTSIKRDLGMSDVQMALAIGLAFAISNVAITIPAGWLADRFNRRAIVGGAVGLWSIMAMLCGTAGNFATMFAARFGVGLGEGLSPPSSYSLIRDGVPDEERGRAYSFFAIGASVGGGLAFVIGGGLLGLIIESGVSELPLLGPAHPWQIALVLIGLGGIPLSLLVLTFPDPGRGTMEGGRHLGFRDIARLMVSHRGVIVPLMIYAVASSMLTNGYAAWAPALIERKFHLAPAQIGPIIGTILIVGAPIGLMAAGYVMDRLMRNGAALVATATACVMMVATVGAALAPSIGIFWIPQTLIVLSSVTFLAVTSTVVARTVPSEAVGKTVAVFLLAQGALGSGLGPLVIALLAEHVFAGGDLALGSAVASAAVVLGGGAAVAGYFVRSTIGSADVAQNAMLGTAISAPSAAKAHGPT